MKIPFLSFRTGVAAILLAVGGFVFAGTGILASGASIARHPVLVIDRQAIMTGSKLGKDIKRQIMAYEDEINVKFGAQREALQKESQDLQSAAASLPAAERDKKVQALQARQAAFDQKVQVRQSLVQGGEMVARQRYLAELAKVVEAIMQEQGADVVVEKSTVVASVGGLDITPLAIQRLDHALGSFKVPLVNPPASETSPLLH